MFLENLRDLEIGRASNLEELAKMIDEMPIETIEFHAKRNEFSHWLRGRTEFSLAASLRTDDFG